MNYSFADSCGTDLAVIASDTSPGAINDFQNILPGILCGRLIVITAENGNDPFSNILMRVLDCHRRAQVFGSKWLL